MMPRLRRPALPLKPLLAYRTVTPTIKSEVVNGELVHVAAARAPLLPGEIGGKRSTSRGFGFQHTPKVVDANVLFVVGGLYGNTEAMRAVEMRAAEEAKLAASQNHRSESTRGIPMKIAVVFNGDFNFFNASSHDWEVINRTIMYGSIFEPTPRAIEYFATAGNIETEASDFRSGAADGGCGCAYPGYVPDAVVRRAGRIVQRLRRVACEAESCAHKGSDNAASGSPPLPFTSAGDLSSSQAAGESARKQGTVNIGRPSIVAWLRGLPEFLTVKMGGSRAALDRGGAPQYTNDDDSMVARAPRVGVIHGDPKSLAGWAFSCEAMEYPFPDWKLRRSLGIKEELLHGMELEPSVAAFGGMDNARQLPRGCLHERRRYQPPYFRPTALRQINEHFRTERVDVFACTHTCVPFGQVFDSLVVEPEGTHEVNGRRQSISRGSSCASGGKDLAIINNGSAGLPNFDGRFGLFGVMTRIEAVFEGRGRPCCLTPPRDSLYGAVLDCGLGWGLRVDALPVRYDHAAFESRFLETWPEGSDAHLSYHGRISRGFDGYEPRQAARRGFALSSTHNWK